MYCDLVADSVIGGIQQEMVAAGVDVGGAEEQQERLADVDEATGAVDVVEPAEPTAAVEPAAAMEATGTADVVEPAEPTSAVEPGAVAATQATEDAPASADEPSASADEPSASASRGRAYGVGGRAYGFGGHTGGEARGGHLRIPETVQLLQCF